MTASSANSPGSPPGELAGLQLSRPAELARAQAAVAGWRDQNPAGNAEELIAAIGHRFQRDYDVVLRAMLFAVDRHRARQVTDTAFVGRLP